MPLDPVCARPCEHRVGVFVGFERVCMNLESVSVCMNDRLRLYSVLGSVAEDLQEGA